MAATMAATRQPFAPLNSSRLQNLTSLKNSQNALPTTLTSPSKRKAETFDFDSNDSENIDPAIFLSPKRSKAADGLCKDGSILKPTNFFLTKAPPSPCDFSSLNSANSARRPMLQPRSPAPRLNTTVKASPLTAPAGRSPTRKRIGILNRRKTASPFTRIDPPKFSTSSTGLGFSIDAALSGTIPSYGTRHAIPQEKAVARDLYEPSPKDSWFFEIHEDTPEEEATNLMEHSTCTLDISSDEESATHLKDERGKENIPPVDDISQTRSQITSSNATAPSMSDIKARVRASRRQKEMDENAIEIDRSPLGDLVAEDFYAEGCDDKSVFLIPSEEQGDEPEDENNPADSTHVPFDFRTEVKGKGKEIDIDALMRKDSFDVAPKAALLEPIEKAGEEFEVWESGSAKGDD